MSFRNDKCRQRKNDGWVIFSSFNVIVVTIKRKTKWRTINVLWILHNLRFVLLFGSFVLTDPHFALWYRFKCFICYVRGCVRRLFCPFHPLSLFVLWQCLSVTDKETCASLLKLSQFLLCRPFINTGCIQNELTYLLSIL